MPQYSHTSSGEENVEEAERKVERRYDREKEEKEVERKEISGGGGNVRRGGGANVRCDWFPAGRQPVLVTATCVL